MSIKVTREQMLQIMPTAKERVDKYLTYINSYAEVFEIDTQLRMAHYLAQIAHESGELRYTVEQGSKSYFDKYDTGNLARQLGNTPQKDGDGYKYRGRGLIQITGRANYDAYNRSAYCKGDVMKTPELLEKPLGAVKSSMWWWNTHGLNILADNDDVVKITKKINGGQNGLKERCGYLARAKRALGMCK